MTITIGQMLRLAGKLDDSPDENAPRDRFREFLNTHVREIGQIRDLAEECLGRADEQNARALQDLVNHTGRLLGFEVEFGRYNGGKNGMGSYDGYWRSPTGFHLVVEAKSSEIHPIKTATLVGYVDQLISQGRIPSWDSAMGLYVIGRPHPEINQLQNAITAEKRTHQLRLLSMESLLTIAELMDEHDVAHEDILPVFRPAGPSIDPVVELLARLMAQQHLGTLGESGHEKTVAAENGTPSYWLAPVKGDNGQTAEGVIQTLVGQGNVFAFREQSPARKSARVGDSICFYAASKGIVGHARLASAVEKGLKAPVDLPEKYPWLVRLGDVQLYIDSPVALDVRLRARLDAFRDHDPERSWAWFVQPTHRITAHDFEVLTRR